MFLAWNWFFGAVAFLFGIFRHHRHRSDRNHLDHFPDFRVVPCFFTCCLVMFVAGSMLPVAC